MKVLWLVNIVLPDAATALGLTQTPMGGWVIGALNGIIDACEEINIVTTSNEVQTTKEYADGKIRYYVFPEGTVEEYQDAFEKTLKMESYDVVQVFGTEEPHALAMLNCSEPFKTVLNIQGLVNACLYHYCDGVPNSYIQDNWLRKVLRNLKIGKMPMSLDLKAFGKNAAETELAAIRRAKNVIGRTNWDRACIAQINEDAHYFSVNETLREEFYMGLKWDENKCEKHSIFISQAHYPIKGLHTLLKALPTVLKRYPDTQVYIGGPELVISRRSPLMLEYDKRLTGYWGYIRVLMEENQLHEHIHFLGRLDVNQMIERYLRANVYVLPSSIENGSNSLGEAMILGVPCVASYVGGIPDMLKNGEEGILYSPTAPYMLADGIIREFENSELASFFSRNAQIRANRIYDREGNAKRLLEVYSEIIKRGFNTEVKAYEQRV